MKNTIVRLIGCGVVAVTLISSLAKAEVRYLGMFEQGGFPLSREVNKIPSDLTVIPSGHLPGPDLTIYDRTRQRLGVNSPKIDQRVLKLAKERLADAMSKIKSKTNLVALAKRIAPLYGIDPVIVIACILGEMTFNNPTEIALQDFVAKLTPGILNFRYIDTAKAALDHPNMVKYCRTDVMDYWSWLCADLLWGSSYHAARGTVKLSSKYIVPVAPDALSFAALLMPTTGTSYGPAQLQIAVALRVSADVARVSKGQYQRLGLEDLNEAMNMIVSGEGTVHILSALIARGRVAYKMFAKIDTSQNIGIETTLFNLGGESSRALMLGQNNRVKVSKGQPEALPRENYFGWFVQEHESAIRSFVEKN